MNSVLLDHIVTYVWLNAHEIIMVPLRDAAKKRGGKRPPCCALRGPTYWLVHTCEEAMGLSEILGFITNMGQRPGCEYFIR